MKAEIYKVDTLNMKFGVSISITVEEANQFDPKSGRYF